MDKKLQFRKVVEQIKKENSKPVEDLSLLVKEDSERQDKEISQLKEKQEQIENQLEVIRSWENEVEQVRNRLNQY